MRSANAFLWFLLRASSDVTKAQGESCSSVLVQVTSSQVAGQSESPLAHQDDHSVQSLVEEGLGRLLSVLDGGGDHVEELVLGGDEHGLDFVPSGVAFLDGGDPRLCDGQL